jgi:peptidoglycan hydrolase CwlO-like protein
MKKNDIITKLQAMAASAREELNKNDGSTLQTISNAIMGGYESVRTSIAESDRTKKALTAAKQYLNRAGKAIKSGDRKLSANTLDALDKLLKEHKEATEKKKASPKKASAKATAKRPAATAAKKMAAVKSGGAEKTVAKPAAKKAPAQKG